MRLLQQRGCSYRTTRIDVAELAAALDLALRTLRSVINLHPSARCSSIVSDWSSWLMHFSIHDHAPVKLYTVQCCFSFHFQLHSRLFRRAVNYTKLEQFLHSSNTPNSANIVLIPDILVTGRRSGRLESGEKAQQQKRRPSIHVEWSNKHICIATYAELQRGWISEKWVVKHLLKEIGVLILSSENRFTVAQARRAHQNSLSLLLGLSEFWKCAPWLQANCSARQVRRNQWIVYKNQ